jgi:hypothetical protein
MGLKLNPPPPAFAPAPVFALAPAFAPAPSLAGINDIKKGFVMMIGGFSNILMKSFAYAKKQREKK